LDFEAIKGDGQRKSERARRKSGPGKPGRNRRKTGSGDLLISPARISDYNQEETRFQVISPIPTITGKSPHQLAEKTYDMQSEKMVFSDQRPAPDLEEEDNYFSDEQPREFQKDSSAS
jgi:hypothetical protein